MPSPFPSLAEPLPESFPVRVLMHRQSVRDNPWIDHRWEALGVLAGESEGQSDGQAMERDGMRELLFNGHQVTLHRDECESYYHNLLAPESQCYVLARVDDDGIPQPFLVSLSFDEANAYLETDDVEVYSVPVPPELYRWTEAYVLANYVPERRRKRKLDNWRQGEGR